jgi:hypothetical protein
MFCRPDSSHSCRSPAVLSPPFLFPSRPDHVLGSTGSEGKDNKRTLITSIGDLQLKIYTERKDTPGCIRLLNMDGPVGCSSRQVSAPLQHVDDLGDSNDGASLLLPVTYCAGYVCLFTIPFSLCMCGCIVCVCVCVRACVCVCVCVGRYMSVHLCAQHIDDLDLGCGEMCPSAASLGTRALGM